MGFAAVWGFALVGVDAVPVRVEAHARQGLPGMTIVGLPGVAVREARERVRSGAACSGLSLPVRRMTINLSPADVPKDGPGFDLPMALAMLAACGHVPVSSLDGVGAIGEVSLDGIVRPCRGMVPVIEAADLMGLHLLIAPVEGLAAADAIGTSRVVGVRSMREAADALTDPGVARRLIERGRRWSHASRVSRERVAPQGTPDLAEVGGHQLAKRALEIVAAGGHHLLMVGPPGVGKTMLARRLPGILPKLTRPESLEVTRVWSAVGLATGHEYLVGQRPFRAPHHTASRAALVGGGTMLRPGEVSLAHHGVLFLDELPEFSRDALEALRQPLEEGRVLISRRSGTSVFPAACSLVGAMNPCPCGYLGHPERECRCPASALERYRARISGPLLDRIDVLVEMAPVSLDGLLEEGPSEGSAAVAGRVAAARTFKEARVAFVSCCRSDPVAAAGTATVLEGRASLTPDARRLLQRALVAEGLSGRAYVRTINVARTIADLDASDQIGHEHVAEALSLRLDGRRMGMGC